jgi:nucleoside-diphosphate-sugar epimerase
MLANCLSSIKLIELFRLHRANPIPSNISISQMLPEIWYLGSEIEIISPPNTPDMLRYSASKRAFAKYARAYYDDRDFLYRHIIPAGFTSSMGKGLVSADWAAAVTMFFVRRGARYVPVTYTGMAYLNYFRFMGLEPVKAEEEVDGK